MLTILRFSFCPTIRMEEARQFLESSTIHGLVYISSSRGVLRLIWLCVVIAGFSLAGLIIQQSFSSWADSPVSTTIETLPITELDFPNVIVCPPRNTFTTLNPDLVMVRNVTLDEEEKVELKKLVGDSIYRENYKARYLEFQNIRQQKLYVDWYRGVAKIEFPGTSVDGGNKVEFSTYYIHTASLEGQYSSPYFGQTFDENSFEQTIKGGVQIYLHPSENLESKIVIDIEYDVEETSYTEYVQVITKYRDERSEEEFLDKTKMKAVREYREALVVAIFYVRWMWTEYNTWDSRRNTGDSTVQYSTVQYSIIQYEVQEMGDLKGI